MSLEAIKDVRARYAPPDDPVFELVPPAFAALANQTYQSQGARAISRDSIWWIYAHMLVAIRDVYRTAVTPALEAAARSTLVDDGANASPAIPLTPGLAELRNGDPVVGSGVASWVSAGGPSGATHESKSDGMPCVAFSDEDSESADER